MQHLWFDKALLPEGWAQGVRIGIDGTTIASIATGVEPQAADDWHKAAIPGLCNLHSHGFQRGMAGLAERRVGSDDFWSWRELMYRFLDRMTPDDIQAITAQAYVEMLEGGFTRVGEFHYLHHDVDGRRYADPAETAGAVIAAANEAGIALTLLPVFYAHGDFGGALPVPLQRRFLSDIDGFGQLVEAIRSKLPEGAVLGIAPHSLRAVTPDELRAIVPLAAGGPIHIHAAEQLREVEACLAWSGARPVDWLLANMDVDRRWCLVHATHMDGGEARRLAASGAIAGVCPITEANLGDGVFPAVEYLAAGGKFGVGTDSNVWIEAAAELRALEYSQRLVRRQRALIADAEQPSVGQCLFGAALAGGAQGLGVEPGIAAGMPADIVALDLEHPAMQGADDRTLLDRWIFAARGGAIDCVWRGGRKLVQSGCHVAAKEVADRFGRTMASLLS